MFENRPEDGFEKTPKKVFEKILVALDLSDSNKVVFDRALALAVATQSSLMLLHVPSSSAQDGGPLLPIAATGDYYTVMSDFAWSRYQSEWKEYEQRSLETLRRYAQQASQAGVTVELTQSGSQPSRAICDLAKNWEADTIVVGSHRRKGLSELLVGSVSNYVMHHAPCPVLVVHVDQVALKTPLHELSAA